MRLLAVELQRNDWVFAGGLDGWIHTEEDADGERDATSDAEDAPGNMWCEWGNEGNEEGADVAKGEAHDAAHDAEDHGFEEEL